MWRLPESNLFDRLKSFLKNSDQVQGYRLKAGLLRKNFSAELERLSKICSVNLSLRGAQRRSNLLENLRDCFASLAMTFEKLAKSIGTYF